MGIAIALLAMAACAGADVPECMETYPLYGGPNIPLFEDGIVRDRVGTLEQQVLEDGLIVHGKLVKSEAKVVETASLPFEAEPYLDRSESNYPKYMTVSEVKVEVIEYLNGEGPDDVTAIIDGQVRFSDWAARHCAMFYHEQDVLEYLNLDEGIAYLKATEDPDIYYLGLSINHFSERPHTRWLHHVGNGKFYDKNEDEWIRIGEARRRIATVVEEYNRHGSDVKWRECVESKYWRYGWRRGQRMGLIRPSLRHLPKQIIHLRDESAPIEAGAMIWQLPRQDYESDGSELNLRLEGEDADKFEVNYQEEFQYSRSRWKGDAILVYEIYWGIWTPRKGPLPEGDNTQLPGHLITVSESLPAGTYRFYLYEEAADAVDCGQEEDPTEYVVVVTEEGKSLELPPPPTVTKTEWTDDSVIFQITPVTGVSKHLISAKYSGKPYQYFEPIGEITDETTYTVWLDDFECGQSIWIGAQSFGDGERYAKFWGEPEYEWRNHHRTRECDPPKIRK